MKIRPVLTEKSLEAAKTGNYTFWVLPGMDKGEIKRAIESLFKVHAKSVRTMNFGASVRRNYQGKTQTIKARKKAIVTLAKDEKIDLFEEKVNETKKNIG